MTSWTRFGAAANPKRREAARSPPLRAIHRSINQNTEYRAQRA
jgi:hypothetical protein